MPISMASRGGTETTATTSITANRIIWQQWASTSSVTSTTNSTGNAIWERWITNGTASATMTTGNHTVSDDSVWHQWVTTTTAGTGDATIWVQWVENGQTAATNTPRARNAYPRIEVDPQVQAEARRARAEREAEYRRQREEERRKREEANERAMRLLREVLTDEQNRDLERHGHFFVKAASGRLYRIGEGRSGNVKVVDPVTKEWQESLCIHQQAMVPYGDTMLMQKLLIETAEELFRSYANIDVRGGRWQQGRGGLLTSERLAEVIPFPDRERRAAA